MQQEEIDRLRTELKDVRQRLVEVEEVVQALRSGAADALIVAGPHGDQVYTLRSADRPYRLLVETINEGALTLLHNGMIVYANQHFAAMVQLPPAQIPGGVLADLICPDDRAQFAELFAAGLLNSSRGDVHLQRADGVLVPVQISLRTLHDEDLQGVCVVVTDLTERQLAASQMRIALHEKELLLKEVHHRVKNNLQIIASLLRLQAETLTDAQLITSLNDSQNRVRAMALVHEQLYSSGDLAQIDIGRYLRFLGSSIQRSYLAHSLAVDLIINVDDQIFLNPDPARHDCE
ncbi:MAG TPA: histidine kinase dimerization/phosphoacceptor domain -containing protein [Roseiflexaceae bacterium]|nr:histidine kinase dimerization/phosphoacceptor domain -containing protein [Roseiflexaceae bacterium]